jgi:hypothetical protein
MFAARFHVTHERLGSGVGTDSTGTLPAGALAMLSQRHRKQKNTKQN